MISCYPGNQIWQLAGLRIHAGSKSGHCDASLCTFLLFNGFYHCLTLQRRKSSRCIWKAEQIVTRVVQYYIKATIKWTEMSFWGINHCCRWNPVDLKLTSGRPLSGSQSLVVCASPPEWSSWFLSQFVFCLASALPAWGTTRVCCQTLLGNDMCSKFWPWPGSLQSEPPCWTALSSSWPHRRPSSWPLRPPFSVSPPVKAERAH